MSARSGTQLSTLLLATGAVAIAIAAPRFFASFGLSAMTGWLTSLTALGIGIVLMLRYVASVYPFWRVSAAPTLKPFVFVVRLLIFATISLLSAALLLRTTNSFAADSLLAAAVVAGLAAAYDAFVWTKARALRTKADTLARKAGEATDDLDTHGLLSDAELSAISDSARGDRVFLGSKGGKPVFCEPVHLITYGGPGSGKGTSVVIPNLFSWKGSMFVTDPKGENASITARFRRDRLGHKIAFLNPWELNGFPNHSFNPLQMVLDAVKHSRDSSAPRRLQNQELDDTEAVAKLLVPDPLRKGDNDWVYRLARELLKTFILYLAYYRPQNCDLPSILRCLKQPEDRYLKHFKRMLAMPPVMGGELHRLANKIMDDYTVNPKQHFAGKDEAIQALSIFADYGALGRSTRKSVFSLRDFVESGAHTIYLILPLNKVKSHGAWAGLVAANVFEAIGKYGRGEPVLTLLDEFANLGKLTMLDKLAGYRGHGLRAWL